MRQAISLNTELTNLARLAYQGATGIYLSSVSRNGVTGALHQIWYFYTASGHLRSSSEVHTTM